MHTSHYSFIVFPLGRPRFPGPPSPTNYNGVQETHWRNKRDSSAIQLSTSQPQSCTHLFRASTRLQGAVVLTDPLPLPTKCTSRCHFPHTTPPPLPTLHIFSTSPRVMADQLGTARFRLRFESALQAFQQTTGVILAEHPLTVQLQHPHSIEAITAILKYEARVSSGLLGCDGIVKSIESTVSMLFSISATAPFSEAIVLVRKGALRSSVYTSLTCLYSHSHLRKQYLLASLSCFLYVPLSSTYVVILVTSR